MAKETTKEEKKGEEDERIKYSARAAEDVVEAIMVEYGVRPYAVIHTQAKNLEETVNGMKKACTLLCLDKIEIEGYDTEEACGDDKKLFMLFIFPKDYNELAKTQTKNKIIEAQYYDQKLALGRLLHYPECCVKNFTEKHIAAVHAFLNESIRQDLAGTCTSHGPEYWGIAMPDNKNSLYSRSTLPYVPCSPDCKKTQKYVDARLYTLATHLTNLVNKALSDDAAKQAKNKAKTK